MENNLQNESTMIQEPVKTTQPKRKEMDEDVTNFLLLSALCLVIGAGAALGLIFALEMKVFIGIIAGVFSALFVFEIFFSEKIRELIGAGFAKTVDLPGIIFELDVDGILLYILYKWIVAPLLTLFIAILFGLGALLIAFIISPFFFPFTLGAKIGDLA
jgi:hypothetical protein